MPVAARGWGHSSKASDKPSIRWATSISRKGTKKRGAAQSDCKNDENPIPIPGDRGLPMLVLGMAVRLPNPAIPANYPSPVAPLNQRGRVVLF